MARWLRCGFHQVCCVATWLDTRVIYIRTIGIQVEVETLASLLAISINMASLHICSQHLVLWASPFTIEGLSSCLYATCTTAAWSITQSLHYAPALCGACLVDHILNHVGIIHATSQNVLTLCRVALHVLNMSTEVV